MNVVKIQIVKKTKNAQIIFVLILAVNVATFRITNVSHMNAAVIMIAKQGITVLIMSAKNTNALGTAIAKRMNSAIITVAQNLIVKTVSTS